MYNFSIHSTYICIYYLFKKINNLFPKHYATDSKFKTNEKIIITHVTS